MSPGKPSSAEGCLPEPVVSVGSQAVLRVQAGERQAVSPRSSPVLEGQCYCHVRVLLGPSSLAFLPLD
jgi:hypothetical protein